MYMNSVQLAALYLDYEPHELIRATKIVELAEQVCRKGSDDYYDYINKHTSPKEKEIVNIIIGEELLVEGGREYMGVTVYKNDNGTYSVPELGIYNIEGSPNVKAAIKSKLAITRNVSLKEDIDTVIDNLYELYDLSEHEFFGYVLEEMTEYDFKQLGGHNFKNFVLTMADLVDATPTSLINESYVFDEGFGDFVKKVKDGFDDAHINISYISPKAGEIISAGHKRHREANVAVRQTKDKIKNAVANKFSKENISSGVRTAGYLANAASKGINKTAAKIAGNAVAGVKTAASLTDKEVTRKPQIKQSKYVDELVDYAGKDPKKSQQEYIKKHAEKIIKNLKNEDVDTQLDVITSYLIETEQFDYLEEIDDYILNYMTIDDYTQIISEVSSDNYMKNNNVISRLADAAKLPKKKYSGSGETSKEGVARRNENRKVRNTNSKIDDAKTDYTERQKLINTPGYGNSIGRELPNSPGVKSSIRLGSSSVNNADNSRHPELRRAYNKSTGLVVRQPDKTDLVPTSKSYDKPLGRPIAPPSERGYDYAEPRVIAGEPAKPLGKPIDNPHNIAMKNALLALHEPAAKQSPYSRFDSSTKKSTPQSNKPPLPPRPTWAKTTYASGLNTVAGGKTVILPDKDSAAIASRRNSKFKSDGAIDILANKSKRQQPQPQLDQSKFKFPEEKPDAPRRPNWASNDDDFTSRLGNVFSNNSVKPSNLVDMVSKNTKMLGGKIVSSIKKRLMKESVSEFDIKNYITEDELTAVVECLLEYEVFDTDKEIEDYIMEGLNWNELDYISQLMEADALSAVVMNLINEDTMVETYTLLEDVLGEEFIEILEQMSTNTSDSDFYEPMPIKSKKNWKDKLYKKMGGC